MPFKSQAQRRYMHAKHPKIAKRWEKHTPKGKKLPEKVQNECDDMEESLSRDLDIALGLFEAAPNDPQATTRPRLGVNKGASKGPKKAQVRKKKQADVEPVGEG